MVPLIRARIPGWHWDTSNDDGADKLVASARLLTDSAEITVFATYFDAV